jgi:Fe-S cluster assembly ATP-binding protein
MSTLDIRDLKVSIETDQGTKHILKGVDLTVNEGEIHAVMGPNGSGKSTLAYTIAGHPRYTVEGGSITFDGRDVLAMTVDERARAGLFLAMQYPVEIPGVTVTNFLRTAKTAIDGEEPSIRHWGKTVKDAMADLRMDPEFAARNVNEGFSGGEKKRHEIVQMLTLDPSMALLDESDSGLDIDALKVVAKGINALRGPDKAILMITHYQRLLDHVVPDVVHVMKDGVILRSGGRELAEELETSGYAAYGEKERAAS